MKIDFAGKRVLVTAGAAGIGRVIAERFADDGAQVMTCDISREALIDLRTARPGIVGVLADVSIPDDVDRLFTCIQRQFNGLDILINNAGISGPTKPVEEITPEEWTRTLSVNVTGQFLVTRRAVPGFKSQRAGVILNISSTAGRMGMPLRSAYSTSKYAVRGFADALAVELGEFNIRVNSILPGLVDGARGRRVISEQAQAVGQTYEQYLPKLLHNISMHSLISVDEVASMALFLSSDWCKHISGQSVGVCGNFESYRAPLGASA
jgi:NAD(P)-dependent dehydrogenase (short-subunit alcohol dehydrogenase family)